MIQKFITKFSDREKKIACFSVLFTLVWIMDLLFFSPVFKEIEKLDQSIVQEETSINEDLRYLTRKERILEENQSYRRYFSKKIPTQEEIIAVFLKRVEILSTRASVNLIKVSPSPEKEQDGYTQYFAELECEGQLDHVVEFVHLIGSSEDLLKIVQFHFRSKRAGSDEIRAVMTVSKIIVPEKGATKADHSKEKSPDEQSEDENLTQAASGDNP